MVLFFDLTGAVCSHHSAAGGLSFTVSSGNLERQKQDPKDPAYPVKSESYLTGVNPACPME